MTKKDYEKAAKIISECTDSPRGFSPRDHETDWAIKLFVRLFLDDNPRFDVDRFRRACRGEDRTGG